MKSHLRPQWGLQRQSGAVCVFAHWLHGQKKEQISDINGLFLCKTGMYSGWMRQRTSSVSVWGSFQCPCAMSDWFGDPERRKMDAYRQTDRQTDFSSFYSRITVVCLYLSFSGLARFEGIEPESVGFIVSRPGWDNWTRLNVRTGILRSLPFSCLSI